MGNEAKRRKKAPEKPSRNGPKRPAEAALGAPGLIQTLMDTSHERGLLLASDGTILALNRAAARSFGLEPGAAVGRCAYDLMPPELVPARKDAVERAIRQGRFVEIEDRRGDRWLAARLYPVRDPRGKPTHIAVFATDVTDRHRTAAAQETSVQLLRLLNAAGTSHDLLRGVLGLFQRESGCEAVGIRLRDGDDFPYYEATGFTEEFVQAENTLCAYDEAGNLRRDSRGRPLLECMCGNILQGRFDPSKPFFTEFGSFWTNSTTDLIAGSTEADRQGHLRNRCNTAGYESVALIPLRTEGQTVGLLQLNGTPRDRFTPEAIALYEQLAGHVAISLAQRLAEEALRRSEKRLLAYQKQLRQMAADLNLAEDNERRRIAGDLHDGVGQTLAVAKMKLDLARQSPPCAECVEPIEEIAGLVAEAALALSDAVFDLSPHALYELGLGPAVERLVERMQERHPHLRFALKVHTPVAPLPEEARTILFRAVRELMLNAARHARAHNVRVSLRQEQDSIRVDVEDDGIGFDPTQILVHANAGGGFGLLNIRERLEYMGGRVEIDSRTGRGTTARLVVPLGGG